MSHVFWQDVQWCKEVVLAMNFDKKRPVKLGGRKEVVTRDKLVSVARADREAREAAKRRVQAAKRIQRCYRGWIVRRTLVARLKQDWLRQWGSAAAAPDRQMPAAELTQRVLPPLLLAYLPPVLSVRRQAVQRGARMHLEAAPTDTAPLRGGLALVLRSLSAPDPRHNYASLAAAEDDTTRGEWLHQCRRLLLCCTAMLGSPPGLPLSGDLLLQAAAARTLAVLCDDLQWKCYPAGAPAASRAVAELSQWASGSAALSGAAGRMVAQHWAATKQARTAESGGCASPDGGGGPGGLRASDALTMVQGPTHNVLRLALRPLLGGAPADSTAAANGAPAADSALEWGRASRVLTVAHLTDALPVDVRDRLAAAEGLHQCCTALQQLPAPERAPAVRAVAGLGAGSSEIRAVVGDSDRRQLGPAALGAQQYMHAMLNLAALPFCKAPDSQEGQAALDGVVPTALHLLRTLRLLLDRALSAPRGAPPAATHGELRDGGITLWPLDEARHITRLLRASHRDVLPFLQLYHRLLGNTAAIAALLGAPAEAESLTRRLVNALAFGCPDLLPTLWKWLAHAVGLPLAAPEDSTRGWDIAALSCGARQLRADHARGLGLFCRVYAHLLLVMDDREFHGEGIGGGGLSLGQQRAVATAVNTLVFRTHCPAGTPAAAQGGAAAADTEMLVEWAPSLLRALYERDVRRRYCPAALWLAPYQAAAGEGRDFEAAGVVRALLNAGEGKGDGPPATGRFGAAALASLLLEAPQCVPYERRVQVFRSLIAGLKSTLPPQGPAIQVVVRRAALLEDANDALQGVGADIRRPLHVRFVSEHGHLEAGIDQGGLTKEFLEEVVYASFDLERGLMAQTEGGLAYPHAAAASLPGALPQLRLLGLLLGKALFEGILLDVPLAHFFITHLQGRRATFDDLSTVDSDVHRNLITVKRYPGDVEDLCLDFTVETETYGKRTCHALKPGGADTPVTNENKLQYVHLAADWHLRSRLAAPAHAFAEGLAQVIPAAWLRLFNQVELNELLSGGASGGADPEDMRAHAAYSGGYSPDSRTVKLFWQVVTGFSNEQRQALLKFATSCSRGPLGGFRHLVPPLRIHKVDCGASMLAMVGGKDVDRLPSASTCSNMLKLPNYRRADTLREKLLMAINARAGFELS